MKKLFLITLLIGNVAYSGTHTYLGKVVISNNGVTVLDNGKTLTKSFPVGCELVKYTYYSNPMVGFLTFGLSWVIPTTEYYCKNQSAVN